VRFCFGFGFDRGEELRGHHSHRALKHALAHAGDGASDLNLAVVVDYRNAVALLQNQIAGAFQESRLALTVNDHAKTPRRLHVFKANIACE
jgi:hypothetical protein